VSLDDESVRLAIYQAFAASGRAPALRDLAACMGAAEQDVRTVLARLATARHVVLDETGGIVLAHPFSSIPMGFSVMGRATLWWGGCAWDSFALPHLLRDEPEVLVATTCPACDAALAWNVSRNAAPTGNAIAHFLVPVVRMWDDIIHTCRNQRLFCSIDCVERWLSRTSSARGDVLDLATLWRLAQNWYDGRLDRGYRRREPREAKDYFRGVGLSGDFWGLG
jgi:hypothetical protein